MIYSLITNKYGQITIDDTTIEVYILKIINLKYPFLKINSIDLNQINKDLIDLTILVSFCSELKIENFSQISECLNEYLYNNLGLNLKCINIGFCNYDNK